MNYLPRRPIKRHLNCLFFPHKRTNWGEYLDCFTDAAAQSSRDYIYIVGSSTVYPFSTVVAERFGRATEFKTPKVESTGSGGGLKLFCDGIGVDYPDIVNSSRAIKASEVEMCAENGIAEIVEVKIGYDGIVFAARLDTPGFENMTPEGMKANIHLTITDDYPYAQAMVIIEAIVI